MTAHLQSLGSTAQALSVFCAEGAAVSFLGICTSRLLIDRFGAGTWLHDALWMLTGTLYFDSMKAAARPE